MEITPSLIYWFERLSCIKIVGILFGLLAVIGLIMSIIAVCMVYTDNCCDDDDRRTSRHIMFWFIPFCIIFVSIGIFVPSTKEMAAIIIVPKIVNSEKIQNIGNEFYELALDWMKELRPQNIKKD